MTMDGRYPESALSHERDALEQRRSGCREQAF